MMGRRVFYPTTVGIVLLGTLVLSGGCGKKGAPLPPLESPRDDRPSPSNVEQNRQPLPPQ
jgi:predicted small lipoprotein YifL